jgi:hypothetical protein
MISQPALIASVVSALTSCAVLLYARQISKRIAALTEQLKKIKVI